MNDRIASRLSAVAAAAALVTLTTGCGMMKKPSASIIGVKVKDVSMTNATMLFDVKVENPNSVALPMSNVDYALSSRGRQFVDGKADLQGTVPAGGSKTLGIPVRISFLELVKVVQGARPGATIPYKAAMGLSVNVPVLGPLRVPMSKEGNLSIPSASGVLDKLKGLTE